MAPRGAPVFKSPKVTDDAPLATSPRSSPNVDQLTSDLEQLSPATSHSSEFSSTSGPAPISPVVTKGSRFSFSGSHPHPVRTATASSTDSTSSNKHQSSTSVSGESTKSHTGIKHAIRGAAGHHISKPKTQKVPPPFKVPDDPLALCELAISTVLTIPGPPLDELQDVIWPQLYHLGYSHRINCRETDLKGLEQMVLMFRARFQSLRVRFKTHLMDKDGTATMEQAALGLTYDVIAVPHGHGTDKHDLEEHRTTAMSIMKIYQGKLAQTDIVIDTLPFHLETLNEKKAVACLIM